jgi:hypothetical protein
VVGKDLEVQGVRIAQGCEKESAAISSSGSFILFDPQRHHRYPNRAVCGILDQYIRLLQKRDGPYR